MDNKKLSNIISRKMKSGDYCYTRILGCLPDFGFLVIPYLQYYKGDYSKSFIAAVIEWNTFLITYVLKNNISLIDYAISEIFSFKNLLFDMMNNDWDDYSIFTTRVNAITLIHYKKLADFIGIYCNYDNVENYNYSKIIYRYNNFKTKFRKFCEGKIDFDDFMQKEIIPQYKFIKTYYDNIEKFNKEQLPICILCYDLKVSSRVKKVIKKTKKLYKNL